MKTNITQTGLEKDKIFKVFSSYNQCVKHENHALGLDRRSNKLSIIGITALLLLCSFVVEAKEGPIRNSDIVDLQIERQFNEGSFYYAIQDLQNCVRMSNDISSYIVPAINKYQTGKEEVQAKCHSHTITNTQEFELCMRAQSSLLSGFKDLIPILSITKRPCSRTQYPELTTQLETLSQDLGTRISVTRKKYREFSQNQYDIERAENRKKKAPDSIKAGCHRRLFPILTKYINGISLLLSMLIWVICMI